MAKPKIENIHVDSIELETNRFAIGWTIAGHRYHVWGYGAVNDLKLEIEETIFKNCSLAIKYGEPGYYDTRQLDRGTKTQAAIFAEVMAAITARDLIAKAFETERNRIDTARKRAELESKIYALDQEALEEWKTGKFNSSLTACAKLNRRRYLELQLRQIAEPVDSSTSNDQVEFA